MSEQRRAWTLVLLAGCFLCFAPKIARAQQVDQAAVIRGVDAAVHQRVEAIQGYTVVEHYSFFRGDAPTKPDAEMTVKTTYSRESGKSYTLLSETGSSMIRNMVFAPLLENEKEINLPANREASWITSKNYEMNLKPGVEQLDGRACLVLSISPRRKATNLMAGTLWVDAKDDSIVRVEGTATKSVSVFTGPAQMMRAYANVDGFAMATEARAVSSSFLFGKSTMTIEYKDYKIQRDSTP
jgi:hypothetical protein